MHKTCPQFAKNGSCTFGHRCKYLHITDEKTISKDEREQEIGRVEKVRTGVKPTRNTPSNESLIESIPAHGIQQRDAVENFFNKWPTFRYEQNATSIANFYRLCNYHKWHKGHPLGKRAGEGFKTALVLQFNALYGIDADDTTSWQALCQVLKVDTIPRRLNPARQAWSP